MKKLAYMFLLCAMVIYSPLCAFAGESADYAANIIINEYYLDLSAQMREDIRRIAIDEGYDNERIAAMCSLLDEYCEYYLQGLSAAPSTQAVQIESSVNSRLYLKINRLEFGVDNRVKELLEENADKVLFLDLTQCSGGSVTVAESIAQELVPEGIIYTARFRNEEQTACSSLEDSSRVIYVLVGEKTASSAEILAAALQESGAAILVGEQTYGKASMQKQYVLPNGGVLKITVGNWLTRNGVDISGVGITPDVRLNKEGILWLTNTIINK